MDAKLILQMSVDLDKPVEELKACIVKVLSMYPGQQSELLLQLDAWMGETIANVEKGEKHDVPTTNVPGNDKQPGDGAGE